MELWDLYDQNRIRTGETAVRGGGPIPEGGYRVVVHAAVFNDRGDMLIPRRQPWKEVFPDPRQTEKISLRIPLFPV